MNANECPETNQKESEYRWVDKIGTKLIQGATFKIGNTVIEKVVWNEDLQAYIRVHSSV